MSNFQSFEGGTSNAKKFFDQIFKPKIVWKNLLGKAENVLTEF